jgi:hypothetical protein
MSSYPVHRSLPPTRRSSSDGSLAPGEVRNKPLEIDREKLQEPKDPKPFLPIRWIVERTFSWLGQNRRLSKDYERLPESGEAFIYVAMSRLMVRRLARS